MSEKSAIPNLAFSFINYCPDREVLSMNLHELCPYVRLALDSRISAPWELKERVILDYELLLIKSGTVLITIEGVERICTAGDIVLFRPGEPHSIKILGDSAFHQPHIHFDFQYTNDSKDVFISFKNLFELSEKEKALMRCNQMEDFSFHFPHFIKLAHLAEFETLLYQMIDLYTYRRPYYEIALKAKMLELIYYIATNMEDNPNQRQFPNYKKLLEMKDFLTEHYQQNITLDELSNRFSISKFYLVRQFKNMFHQSPIQYHHSVKLEKAKMLLLYENQSISEIAEQLGFDSIYDFSRFFKRYTGVSPSSYYETPPLSQREER